MVVRDALILGKRLSAFANKSMVHHGAISIFGFL